MSKTEWQERYEREFIPRSLLEAATAAGAFNPQQFVTTLAPHARVVETVDSDGRPTCAIRVQVVTCGQTHEASPADAVELLKSDSENANLFREHLPPDFAQAPKTLGAMSTDEYMSARRQRGA
jgi:hypothetical protein